MKNKFIYILLFLCCVLCLWACGSEEEEIDNLYNIYYVSSSETKVEIHEHVIEPKSLEEEVAEMVECLSIIPDKLEYKAPFAMVELLDTSIMDGKIIFNVSSSYKELPATTEVLVRAAIVRTLTQLEGIKYVSITVNGDPLYDTNGKPIGFMSASNFINNDGNEINTYELIRVKLYFANDDGDNLIAAYREKHYSTNTPLERFVVEEIIAGPSGQIEGLYPTVNPSTKIISVSTKDGICYVNLDSAFLTVVNNVSSDIAIYSIVNSLVELSNINKVQILINGEVPSSFSASTYERKLDIVTTLEP